MSGVVLDPSGAVIAGATVTLRRDAGRWSETTTANQRGEFRFSRVSSGDYEIEAKKDGFKTTITQLKVETRSADKLELVLPVADVHEEMAVAEPSNKPTTNPEENLNVIKLDPAALKNLPVLGNDVIAGLANLLDPSSLGSGGPSVIVDGLETAKKVRASTIKEVRINQNPYSAERQRVGCLRFNETQ